MKYRVLSVYFEGAEGLEFEAPDGAPEEDVKWAMLHALMGKLVFDLDCAYEDTAEESEHFSNGIPM